LPSLSTPCSCGPAPSAPTPASGMRTRATATPRSMMCCSWRRTPSRSPRPRPRTSPSTVSRWRLSHAGPLRDGDGCGQRACSPLLRGSSAAHELGPRKHPAARALHRCKIAPQAARTLRRCKRAPLSVGPGQGRRSTSRRCGRELRHRREPDGARRSRAARPPLPPWAAAVATRPSHRRRRKLRRRGRTRRGVAEPAGAVVAAAEGRHRGRRKWDPHVGSR